MQNAKLKNVFFSGGTRMSYTLFPKTEIASYTDVAALFCVVPEDNTDSMFWKYQLYGNLSWDKKTNTMYHCGKYSHFSYMELENEDRIVLKKLSCSTHYNKIKDYIDKGFFVLLPINTQTLGYTDDPYIHNVFVTGYENDKFIVFDFWTTSFTWKYEKVGCKCLFDSIDFSNNETVQMIYAFKYNESYRRKHKNIPEWEELKKIYTKEWNPNLNKHYDTQKNEYGFAVYQAMCEHLNAIDKFTLTDGQNMHVILDHLQFTQNTLDKLFGDNQIITDLISKYGELIHRVKKMRTIAYKYYISQKDIGKIRDLIVEEIIKIRETEKAQVGRIIARKGGTNAIK